MTYPYQLKIKILSLVDETANIRKFENKHALGEGVCEFQRLQTDDDEQRVLWCRRSNEHARIRRDLKHHRKIIISDAMRSTLVAYSYLRGRTYNQIEGSSRTSPAWLDVDKMVLKYGTKDQWRAFADWLPERDTFAKDLMQRQRDKAA